MLEDSILAAARALGPASRVMAFTGAGVSAESGVATFRGAGGMWEGQPVEEVATPEAFRRDPLHVWRFYEARRTQARTVRPNPAHETLATWQARFPTWTLATQNVDGLHQAAGSRDVLELHGGLWRVRCCACGRRREDRTVPLPELPPRCAACGGIERPDIVWFGEMLPRDVLEAASLAARDCQVLLVVGTSAVVYPAAGLVEIAASAGATVIEVNPQASALAHLADVVLRGPAGELLPRVAAALAAS